MAVGGLAVPWLVVYLSLGCPGWDTLPGMGGGCCPPVDVEVVMGVVLFQVHV